MHGSETESFRSEALIGKETWMESLNASLEWGHRRE